MSVISAAGGGFNLNSRRDESARMGRRGEGKRTSKRKQEKHFEKRARRRQPLDVIALSLAPRRNIGRAGRENKKGKKGDHVWRGAAPHD